MIDRQSWGAAWQGAGARSIGDDVHRRLVSAWSEKQRHYHTLQHLRECLEHLGPVQGDARSPQEIAIALWFHDAVYDSTRDDNEARSAEWVEAAAKEAGMSMAVAQRLRTMVMATVDHMPQDDADTQLLVDIDLSILGAPAERFAESNAQIRREYAHIPEAEWRAARQRVLRGFLERPRLYGTERFHSMLEARARDNLEGELKRLGT